MTPHVPCSGLLDRASTPDCSRSARCSVCTAIRPGATSGAGCSHRRRPGWRVVAPDHLGMGYSERIGTPRVLAQRVDDLGRLTDALG